MIMKLLGLRDNDEKNLREGLEQLRTLHDSLSAKYSLRSDLKDLTDRRHAVSVLLHDELDKISEKQKLLDKKTDELSALKEKLDKSLATVEELQTFIDEDEEGNSVYSNLLELIDEDTLATLENESEKIHKIHAQLFDRNGEEISKAEQVNHQIENINNNFRNLFHETNDDDETKFEEYQRKLDELVEYYDDLFMSDDSDSKSEQINIQLKKIQKFHDKIYGNDEKNIPALNDELDNRLENLKNVENRAKSVIGLSSEAGLAGGFVIKGKEAKNGQVISIVVFVVIVLAIFGFNFYLFDKSDFSNMTWDAFLFKLLINAPLIWIATIANINLNRFSRLEQEYSHKEALAKSYERYKTEIQELEKLGIEGSGELKLKLLDINLEAFKVNPAESSDKAKPDFSIRDALQRKSKTSTDE